jgi:hypothetical protein
VTAADCTEKPRGFCDNGAPGNNAASGGAPPDTCHYGCLTDTDCGSNEICLCEDPKYGGRCVFSFCKTDADCGPSTLCASAPGCNQFQCTNDPACAVP